MPGLRLKQEQEVAIFLRLLIVGEETLLQVRGIFQMGCNFVLLPHALISTFQIRGMDNCAPPPRPSGFGSRAQSSNPNIAHPSPVQSSSWTDSRFSPCSLAGFSGLSARQLQPPHGPGKASLIFTFSHLVLNHLRSPGLFPWPTWTGTEPSSISLTAGPIGHRGTMIRCFGETPGLARKSRRSKPGIRAASPSPT